MSTDAVTPLRHRMIEDMNARKLCAGTQRGHIHSCKRFAVFLNRSPDTATAATDAAPTSRDFVPWRFSDAGRPSMWRPRHCRRPKTCTIADIWRASPARPVWIVARSGDI
jgi:hypothetical protein